MCTIRVVVGATPEPADKPSVAPNHWLRPKSISVLHTGATRFAIVLLCSGRQLDATRTSDASTCLTAGRSSALSYNNARVEIAVPNNSRTDKRCRCNQQMRFGG